MLIKIIFLFISLYKTKITNMEATLTFDIKAKKWYFNKKISIWHKKNAKINNNVFIILIIIHHFLVDFIILVNEIILLLVFHFEKLGNDDNE